MVEVGEQGESEADINSGEEGKIIQSDPVQSQDVRNL